MLAKASKDFICTSSIRITKLKQVKWEYLDADD